MTAVAPAPTPGAAPTPTFRHLLALSDDIGTFEHADHAVPRPEHGYCTDDMARVLVAVLRQRASGPEERALARTAMRFLVAAQGVMGHSRNRRDADGRWHGQRTTDDCWGRSMHAFGTAANRGGDRWLRQMGAASFGHAVALRSPWRRATAFGVLGAVEMLESDPYAAAARAFLGDAVEIIGPVGPSADWPWPEPRLTYANATLAEALLAAGHALGRRDVVDDGLRILGWLLSRELVDGHLSPTPVGGGGPGDAAPSFDQQPIEVAAMADACARAGAITGDSRWEQGVDAAVAWFVDSNDVGAAMWDAGTGGGYDGLHAHGPNLNQGAESTLALITTLQHARLRGDRP